LINEGVAIVMCMIATLLLYGLFSVEY